eukprot:jgi/Orpsp1_1/1180680/evm.model.c7180000074305.1
MKSKNFNIDFLKSSQKDIKYFAYEVFKENVDDSYVINLFEIIKNKKDYIKEEAITFIQNITITNKIMPSVRTEYQV